MTDVPTGRRADGRTHTLRESVLTTKNMEYNDFKMALPNTQQFMTNMCLFPYTLTVDTQWTCVSVALKPQYRRTGYLVLKAMVSEN